MSNKGLEVSLTIKLRNELTAPYTRAQRDVQAETRRTTQTLQSLMGAYGKTEAKVTTNVTSVGRLTDAQRSLGVEMQRSFKHLDGLVAVHRSYGEVVDVNRNRTDGLTDSLRTLSNIRGLNSLVDTMKRVGDESSRVQRLWKGMKETGAGVAAGAYVVSKPVKQTADYSLRLANMANTAYSDRDVAGRIAGKAELDSSITSAVRVGGGTRDDAANALDKMIASGAVPVDSARRILPQIMKSATASGGGSAEEMANIAIRSMQDMGVSEGDVGTVLNSALIGGQKGGFELKDMAKWLPQQFGQAKLAGLSGMAGIRHIIAANEAAVTTAGSTDEAGNNVVNLLEKLNSHDSKVRAARLGIDLPGTLLAAQNHGQDSLDAFVGLTEKVAGKDPRLKKLREQLKHAGTDAEKRKLFSDQIDIVEGSGIGQLLGDRQATSALVGILNQRPQMKEMMGAMVNDKNGQAIGDNFSVIQNEADNKFQRLMNDAAISTQKGFEGIDKVLGDAALTIAKVVEAHPNIAAGASVATTALFALAAAAGASTLMKALAGGGAVAAGGAVAGTAEGVAGGAATGAALTWGARLAGMGTSASLLAEAPVLQLLATGSAGAVATAAGGVLASAGAGYGTGTLLYNHGIQGTSFGNGLGLMEAQAASLFGGESPGAIQMNIYLDGKRVAEAVNNANKGTGRRQ